MDEHQIRHDIKQLVEEEEKILRKIINSTPRKDLTKHYQKLYQISIQLEVSFRILYGSHNSYSGTPSPSSSSKRKSLEEPD